MRLIVIAVSSRFDGGDFTPPALRVNGAGDAPISGR
jgi:hypothetical protein